MKTFIVILASGFGAGFSPIASGTAGSLVALLLYWFVFPHQTIFLAVITVVTLVISIPVSSWAEKILGRKDDSRIVIDEMVGLWLSVIFLPRSPYVAAAAFVLFRVLDVLKPLYIRKLQTLPGGWGIVLDDVASGILANVILQLSLAVIHAVT